MKKQTKAPAAKAGKKGRAKKPGSFEVVNTGKKPAAPARETIQTQAIAMLQRPEGARLTELMHAFGWARHSTRGFISGVAGKKLGFQIESTKDGEDRIYKIRQVVY